MLHIYIYIFTLKQILKPMRKMVEKKLSSNPVLIEKNGRIERNQWMNGINKQS